MCRRGSLWRCRGSSFFFVVIYFSLFMKKKQLYQKFLTCALRTFWKVFWIKMSVLKCSSCTCWLHRWFCYAMPSLTLLLLSCPLWLPGCFQVSYSWNEVTFCIIMMDTKFRTVAANSGIHCTTKFLYTCSFSSLIFFSALTLLQTVHTLHHFLLNCHMSVLLRYVGRAKADITEHH